jgi:hypothetical protein
MDTFNALQSKSNSLHLRPKQTSDQPIVSAETSTLIGAIIVRGTTEKKRILEPHKELFGQDFDHSIVSKKKGKIELDPNLNFPCINQLWIKGIGYQIY